MCTTVLLLHLPELDGVGSSFLGPAVDGDLEGGAATLHMAGLLAFPLGRKYPLILDYCSAFYL